MNKEQQEAILRMKLLMGYNTKSTLTENYSRLIKEQPRQADYGAYTQGQTLSAGGTPPPRKKLGQGSTLKVPVTNDSSNLWYMTIFLNANPDKIGEGKPYNYIWKSYVNKVAGANLDALLQTRTLALQDQLSYDLGAEGGIIPDLPNFRPGQTGVATALLDSQISNLRLKDYNKWKKKWNETSIDPIYKLKIDPITRKPLLQQSEPKMPEFNQLSQSQIQTDSNATATLFNPYNTKSTLESLGAYNKSATQIKDEEKLKEKLKDKLPDTPFKNTNESDKFRAWLLSKYPEYAKKPKPYNVDLNSKYTNSEALKRAYKDKGKEYEDYLSKIQAYPFDPFQMDYYDMPQDATGMYKSPEIKPIDLTNLDTPSDYVLQQISQQKKSEQISKNKDRKEMWEILKKYANLKYPNSQAGYGLKDLRKDGAKKDKGIPPKGKTYETQGITYDYYYELLASEPLDNSSTWWDIGTNIYDAAIYVGYDQETAKQILDKFGTKNEKEEIFWREYTKKRYEEKLTKKEQEKYNDQQFYNNEKFWQIFGKEKLLNAKEQCPHKLHEFLEKIKNGQIYDKKTGQAYGTYTTLADGRGAMVVWPAKEPIPCVSKTWEEWGGVVMWGSMLLSIALTIPTLGTSLVPLGTTMGTRLFLAAALDVGSNLVSASQNLRAGNEEEAKMDLVIALLSAMVEIPAVSKYLTKGFDDWGEQALREEFSNAGITSYKEFKQWLSTKTPEQQMVMRNILDDDLVQNEIKLFAESQNSPIRRVTDAMDSHIGRVTGKSKMGNLGATILQNIKFKVPITVSPVFFDLGYEYYEQVYLGLESITGKQPSHEDVEIFIENYKKYFPDEDELKKQLRDDPEEFMENAVRMKGEQYRLKNEEMCNCKQFKPPKKVTWKECFAEGSRQSDLRQEQIRKWKEQQSSEIDDKNCESENCESEVEEIYLKVKGEPLDD